MYGLLAALLADYPWEKTDLKPILTRLTPFT